MDLQELINNLIELKNEGYDEVDVVVSDENDNFDGELFINRSNVYSNTVELDVKIY